MNTDLENSSFLVKKLKLVWLLVFSKDHISHRIPILLQIARKEQNGKII